MFSSIAPEEKAVWLLLSCLCFSKKILLGEHHQRTYAEKIFNNQTSTLTYNTLHFLTRVCYVRYIDKCLDSFICTLSDADVD